MSESTTLSQVLEQLERLNQQVSRQQTELTRLKAQADAPRPLPNHSTTTSRRRLLRKLAGGLVAGVMVGGASLAATPPVEARFTVNPAGTNNQIGVIAVPPGKPIPSGTPTTTTATYLYGLVATDGNATFSLNSLGTNTGISYLLGNMGLFANADGDYSTGVRATANGTNSFALFGTATGATSVGVRTETSGNSSYGLNATVYGLGSYGVGADAIGDASTGVSGTASGTAGYGVYGGASGTNSYAGFFSGRVNVSGMLTKPGGSFRIDHPLDPARQYLSHSFVESPDMMNVYNGVITLDGNGQGVVTLAEWFETLNRDFRYQLTCLGQHAPVYISEEVKQNRFKIGGGTAGLKVSWQVTGIRQDAWANAHRIPVAETKPAGESGTYLHPELYGQSQEQGLDFRRQPRPAASVSTRE